MEFSNLPWTSETFGHKHFEKEFSQQHITQILLAKANIEFKMNRKRKKLIENFSKEKMKELDKMLGHS